MGKESKSAQDIEQLRERHQELTVRRGVAKNELESAQRRLAELKAEAQREFGTNDLQELQQKLADLRAENERKRTEYQAHLDAIDARLAGIENNEPGDVEL